MEAFPMDFSAVEAALAELRARSEDCGGHIPDDIQHFLKPGDLFVAKVIPGAAGGTNEPFVRYEPSDELLALLAASAARDRKLKNFG